MNTKEALKLLLEGKKIRNKKWLPEKDVYIKLDEEGNFLYGNDHVRATFTFYYYYDALWEEYIESEWVKFVEFNEVLKHILNGGKAQRLNQDNQLTTVFLNKDGYLMRETIIHNRTTIDLLNKEDLNATNWILI